VSLRPLTPADREIVRKWTVNNLLARIALEVQSRKGSQPGTPPTTSEKDQ
jgi:hypothetical protein